VPGALAEDGKFLAGREGRGANLTHRVNILWTQGMCRTTDI
jgi:hypothetical protein